MKTWEQAEFEAQQQAIVYPGAIYKVIEDEIELAREKNQNKRKKR